MTRKQGDYIFCRVCFFELCVK